MFSKKAWGKWLVVGIIFSLVMIAVAGCGQQQQQTSGVSGTITLAGSTSVQPLAEALAKEFMAKNPNAKINVQGGGSGVGIQSAQNGSANIGTSSRELKPEEKGLKEFTIAKDGIAIVVHPNNPVANLTKDQVKKIFTGEIKNWKEVGGKDAPITVVIREEGSGTRGAFEELVLGNNVKFVSSALIQNSTGAVATTVAGDENSVGFISAGSVDSKVKAVKIDGVEPSTEKILSGEYKISRPFLFLTKEDPKDLTKAFIEFVLSPEGQKIVENEKYVPVKK